MLRLASALTSAAAALGGFLGPVFAQDLRVVDSYACLAAAYDAARGRIVTLGLSGEACEVDGAVVRHLPVPRLTYWVGGLVRTPDGRSLMVVGHDVAQTMTSTFDGVSWQPHAGNAPSRRTSFALACDEARSEVLLFGGYDPGFTPLADTWTFDGTTWTQRQPVNAPQGRMGASAAYDAARARIVLFGGRDLVELADTWEWNGVNWSAASTPNTPPARGWAGLAYDAARSRIVLFGGDQGTVSLADTWEYDGIDWHATQPPLPLPSARTALHLVFDPIRGETVLLGGIDGPFLRDSWTWNGVRWQLLAAPPDPNPRSGLVFADPAGTGLIVADYAVSPSTWRWDASGWTQIAAAAPPRRFTASTAADLTRVFVFGGFDMSVNLLNDLWSFDGTNWTQLSNSGPSPRVSAAMACDLVSGSLVLFGGNDANNVTSGDTWTFDGVAWTQRQPVLSPSTRTNAVATYDFTRQRVVMFGGYGPPNGHLNDTWEWDGANWAPVSSALVLPGGAGLSLAYDVRRGTVLVQSSGSSAVHAWLLGASGWAPIAVGQSTTLNYLSGDKSAHGFPYLGGLLLADQNVVYSLSPQQAEVERYGAACTATAAALMANSWPRPGAADFAVEVVGGPASSVVALVGAVQSASLPVGGCTLLVQPGQLGVLLGTSGAGFVRAPLPVPAAYGLLGTELFFQAASLEASAPAGFTLSRGLHLRIGH